MFTGLILQTAGCFDGFVPSAAKCLRYRQFGKRTIVAGRYNQLANLVRLNVYTTDIDALFPHYGELTGRLGAAGVAPTTTMLEVTRLAIPGQLVELEGTAVA